MRDWRAWAAGILEGEGSFSLSTKPSGSYLHITCNNTDLGMLERLQVLFGGTIYPRKVIGHARKPWWQWQLCRPVLVSDCLSDIWDYMSERRQDDISAALTADARFGSVPTHCGLGHELTPENSYLNGNNGRMCLSCKRLPRGTKSGSNSVPNRPS